MFKKLAALLLALMMLPIFALAEEGCVINLIDNPEAEFAFEEGKDIFTIVYPNVTGSDAAILQYQDEVWMIDCSTDDQSPKFVVPALEDLGITHIDVAFNSHPHDDHITGFEFLDKQATIGKLIVAFDRNHNYTIQRTIHRLGKKNVGYEYTKDGDAFTMGDGGVKMTVIQRLGGGFTDNDKSAMLMIQYGDRTLFSPGDIENRGQKALLTDPPACGVKADVLKYPHHGHAPINQELFDLIDPEIVLISAHETVADDGFNFIQRNNVPGISTWYGIVRFRTDGNIWVVDRLPTRVQNGKNKK